MSTSIYKVEFVCDCGINYGDCGAKRALILRSNNSVDTYELFQTDSHKGTPITTKGVDDCFTDAYLSALCKLMDMSKSNGETLTDEERKVVFDPDRFFK